jgi:hypothetical protein
MFGLCCCLCERSFVMTIEPRLTVRQKDRRSNMAIGAVRTLRRLFFEARITTNNHQQHHQGDILLSFPLSDEQFGCWAFPLRSWDDTKKHWVSPSIILHARVFHNWDVSACRWQAELL